MQLPAGFPLPVTVESIAIRGNNKEVLVPETSVYRVWLQPLKNRRADSNRAIKGNVLIDGKRPEKHWPHRYGGKFAAVFIRESRGFRFVSAPKHQFKTSYHEDTKDTKKSESKKLRVFSCLRGGN